MISKGEIVAELNFYNKLKMELKQELKKLPRGTIYYKKEHGRRRPYTRKNGKLIYLNRKSQELIRGLTQRREYEQALKLLDENIYLLEQLHKDFIDFDEVMPRILEPASERCNGNEYADVVDSWGTPPNPAGKKHITSDGVAVRSKSELILYEYFKSFNIEFQYEKPTFIDGNVWYTDFTLIRKFDRKEIKWEHFGMMDKPEYQANAQNKIYCYAANGYLPFDNFVATYDSGDGNIDMTMVNRLLKMMLLIDCDD